MTLSQQIEALDNHIALETGAVRQGQEEIDALEEQLAQKQKHLSDLINRRHDLKCEQISQKYVAPKALDAINDNRPSI